MGLGSIHGPLLQTPMALLVIEEQVSSTRAIYLHMLQLPKYWVTLEYVHDHPRIPRECRRADSTRAISHHHFQQQGIFFCGGLPSLFPDVCQCVRQPLSDDNATPCDFNITDHHLVTENANDTNIPCMPKQFGIHSQRKHMYRNTFGESNIQYHDFDN